MDNSANDRNVTFDKAVAPQPLQNEFLQSIRPAAHELPEMKDPPEFIRRMMSERKFPSLETLEGIAEKTPHETTPERIEQVRSSMEKSVNELIPEADKAILKQLRDGVLDANPAAIEKAYEGVKDNPKLLHALIKELNSEFKQQDSGVSFAMTDDNRLLVSADGKNGVEFGGKGPEAKSVTQGQDGYLHLAQEQSGSQPIDTVMKGMQQDACSDELKYLQMEDPFKTLIPHHLPQRFHFKPYEPAYLAPGEVWDKSDDLKFPPR